MLREIGMVAKCLRLIVNLHCEQKSAVRIKNEKMEWVRARGETGVCVLSSYFLILQQQGIVEIGDLEDVRVRV